MIQLPSNLTTAGLALLLGLVIGVGGYHLFSSSSPSQELLTSFQQEGLVKVDRDRPLAESDTAGQDEPQIEIRYDTVTVRDTLRVPVPQSLTSGAVLSDRTPLELTSDRATWTYWDPRDSRWEQRIYPVPQERWGASVYALTSYSTPLPTEGVRMGRLRAGIGAEVSYRRLTVGAEVSVGYRLEPVGRARLTYDL